MSSLLYVWKRFCRVCLSHFPQLSIPLSIRSVHRPAINRTVSSIPESLTQMTATVEVIREPEELRSFAQTKLSLSASVVCWARKGTVFFVFFWSVRACLCQRGRVILEQEERLGLSLPLLRDCVIPATHKQTLGKCPFSFFPSLHLSLSLSSLRQPVPGTETLWYSDGGTFDHEPKGQI